MAATPNGAVMTMLGTSEASERLKGDGLVARAIDGNNPWALRDRLEDLRAYTTGTEESIALLSEEILQMAKDAESVLDTWLTLVSGPSD